jgi:hypothetical protein
LIRNFNFCHDEAAPAAEASGFRLTGKKSRSLARDRALVMTRPKRLPPEID